jgi:predicted DsbA family dithiol-disulfide isomerase
MFEPLGLPFAGTLEKVPNSRGALMVGELARERALFAELHPRLFDAYWGRGRDLGDPEVLIDEGAAVGLDRSEIVEVLRDGRYRQQVEDSTRQAIEIGAGGVPAWVIDRRVLVPGAQPYEVFDQVLAQLGHAPAEGE